MGLARLSIAAVALLLLLLLLLAAPAARAADVEFAPVALGTTPDRVELTFVNDGPDQITLDPASITGSDASAFGVSSNGCQFATLEVDEACTLRVRFDPLHTGLSEATLEIPIVGTTEVLSATLAGEGLESLRLAPGSLNFGSSTYSRSAPSDLAVLVENVAAEPISVPSPTLGSWPVFRVVASTCADAELAPGATCAMTVRFTPRTPGTHTDTLQIAREGRVLASASVTGTVTSAPAPWERTRPMPRPAPLPSPRLPTPDVTPALGGRLRAALGAWRKLGAAGLRRGGFAITGLTAPVHGDAHLVVRSGKRIVAKGAKVLVAGKPARLGVRATRFGRKLLADRKARRIEVVLRFVAASDRRVSRVASTVRVPPG
jgi:hypothetical protein